MPKEAKKKMKKRCSICDNDIKVILYSDKTYRGGHYFGKIPLHTEEEFNNALKAGTTKERWGKTVVEILKKDPKPYSHAEYWECPKCYWG